MSYFERSIDYYIRHVLFGGVDILAKRKFRFYALASLFFVVFNSLIVLFISFDIFGLDNLIEHLLYIEFAFAISLLSLSIFSLFSDFKYRSLLFIGLFAGLSLIFDLFLSYSLLKIISKIFFYSWTLLLSLAFFSMINRFMTSRSTQVLVNFGKPKRHVFLFKYLLIIFLIGSAIHILTIYEEIQQNILFDMFGIISLCIWFLSFLHLVIFSKIGIEDSYCSTVSLFYILTFYHTIIYFMKLQSKNIEVAQGIITLDVFFIIVGTLYAIQAVSKRLYISKPKKSKFDGVADKIASYEVSSFQKAFRKIGDSALIFLMLSLAVGYNVFALTISLGDSSWHVAYLFHQVSIFAIFLVLILFIVAYMRSNFVKDHYQNKLNSRDALASFLRILGQDSYQEIIKKLLNFSRDKIKTTTQDLVSNGIKGVKKSISNIFSKK